MYILLQDIRQERYNWNFQSCNKRSTLVSFWWPISSISREMSPETVQSSCLKRTLDEKVVTERAKDSEFIQKVKENTTKSRTIKKDKDEKYKIGLKYAFRTTEPE